MRYTSTATNPGKRAAGFTLIEMLIIAPLILILMSGFIALMVGLVGDVLQTRDKNVLTYNAQDALDRIEQDARLSSKFLSTTTPLTTPQGSNNNFTGSAAFTNASNTLIFSEPATDESPTSPTRSLIYYAYQPNPCGATQTFNRVMTLQVVYFIKDGSLWRRTIVPDYNTNATPNANTICDTTGLHSRPWAQNTCSPGHTASRCETNDEEIMKNIESLSVEYYDSPGSTTNLGAANAEQATTIGVTITGKKTTAGHAFTTSDTLRATKINNLDVDIEAIKTPVVSHTFTTPDKVKFTWAPIVGAVTYNVSYNVNGGAWQNLQLSNGTTSYTVDTASRGDTITFQVAAAGVNETSSNGTDTATLALWTDLDLQNNWKVYSTTSYSSPQFTKSSDGTVFLKGLIRDGDPSNGKVIAQLPEGYRPTGRIFFQTSTNDYTYGRIDIDTNGNIIANGGVNNGYLALDGITFLPSSSPYAWRGTTFSNNWKNYDDGWEQVHSAIDGLGRVHVQGVAKDGVAAHNTVIGQPSSNSGMIPPYPMHFPTGSSTWTNMWVWDGAGQYTKRGSANVAYIAPYAFYYPSGVGSWSNPSSWSNGWGNYGNGYPPLQCTKASDKVVTVRGVISGGDVYRNVPVATLPSQCRPVERQIFTVVAASDEYGRIDVETNGTVRLVQGNGTWDTVNFSFITN